MWKAFTKGFVKHMRDHLDMSVSKLPLKWINQKGRGEDGGTHGFSEERRKGHL